jgi:flagellin
MLSVNTNQGAMIALQYLNQTNAQLEQTENEVNTGLKVATAKDDGSTFAIAQNMRADVAGYQAVSDSLNRGISTADVALSAGQSISDLLIQMKQKALAATDSSLDSTSKAALNADFQAMLSQINTIVKNATFSGANLIDGTTTTTYSALASADGSNTITISGVDMTASTLLGTLDLASGATSALQAVSTAISTVDTDLASLSAGSRKFSIQATFVSQLSDALTTGIGNLVDADMAKESANLTALQTKQQLGVQALSIANSSPQIILSLFK